MSSDTFITGLDLNERFFFEVVRPILDQHFPQLSYAAARIGSGSEVLGFDTVMSTDHDWGPCFQLFLPAADQQRWAEPIRETLRHELPPTFLGYSTHYAAPNEEGTYLLAEKRSGPVNHRIDVLTVRQFCLDYMAYDSDMPPTVTDWLTLSQQFLLGLTAGRVFVDGVGELTAVRETFAYFPRDVWLYLLACQWTRIGQEAPFMGRAGLVGDDIGSRLLAARLVHDVMQLCYLMARQYVPYPKWFGSGFQRLACAEMLTPLLTAVFQADEWRSREAALGAVYEQVAKLHNALGITEPLPTELEWFHDRPFRIIGADKFEAALWGAMQDEAVRGIKTAVGSIDQFSHSTDLRSNARLRGALHGLYLERE